MKKLIPDSIAGRTLLVLIIGLALSHAISIAMYVSDRSNALVSIDGRHIGDQIATVERLIRKSPKTDRQRIANLASDAAFKVSLSEQSSIEKVQEISRREMQLRDSLIIHLDDIDNREFRLKNSKSAVSGLIGGMALVSGENNDSSKEVNDIIVSLSLPDKSWVNFTVPMRSAEPLWSIRFGLSMVVMLIAVAVLSAIVVHQLTRPLARFARASQRLGIDVAAPPLPESGPLEIRQAAQAFNQMQNRIRIFIEDRTQMIAAISHDLGTPIARMRLRTEFVEDDEQRNKMLADLKDMEKMVSSTLSFVRDEAKREPLEKVDFTTLIQRVCDDISDAGFQVLFENEFKTIPYNCHPTALRRALNNLVENAARYGKEAQVFLQEKPNAILIHIVDCGPGIPEDRLEDVFKPFYRLENSRSRETGGTGLGMTVARTIVRAHGGDIVLKNREEGGLEMVVNLPKL
ncbi:MAG: ATP-binding protein [Rhizobiaceae bacterium]|nr:ATP-binding protein [Rhizobiaceae bacterium]